MVANLIVDQQAMATSFNTRGDRHSGSLDHHHMTLTRLGRFQEKTEANINTLVDECQILCMQVESLGDSVCRWAQEETFAYEVLAKPLSRCGERSRHEDREDALEDADVRSEGSHHPPKVAEENVVPLPVPEPTLPAVDQFFPPSDQENIPPRAVTPPPLNVLVPIIEEEPIRVNDHCRRSLAVRSQTCIKSDGRRLSHPYRHPAQMQLATINKVFTTLQDSCNQR